MRAIDLPVDVTRVDEENLTRAILRLALVEEPEGDGKPDRVKHVRADRDDRVDGVRFDGFLGSSISDARASEAEFAITNPARPVGFRAEWKS